MWKLDSIGRISSVLPAKDKRFYFQPASLPLILSIRGWHSWALSLDEKRGTPSYLIGSYCFGKLRMLTMLSSVSESQFVKKIALLLQFTWRPVSKKTSWRTCLMLIAMGVDASVNIITSSAKNRCEMETSPFLYGVEIWPNCTQLLKLCWEQLHYNAKNIGRKRTSLVKPFLTFKETTRCPVDKDGEWRDCHTF